jgi:hypothetical protein
MIFLEDFCANKRIIRIPLKNKKISKFEKVKKRPKKYTL